MTKRHVSLPAAAESAVDRFVEAVDDRLSGPEDTCEGAQETPVDLFGDREPYEAWRAGGDVTPAEKVRLQGYDPCNASLEAEYYAEKDEEQFTRSKHLQWLWRQFDATPMADNVEFALRFRQMLANHLFAEAGDGLRLFKGITFSYGHNIEMGDNVVVHDDVHLDDRGKLTVGDRVSISDDAHVYSHVHDVADQTEVDNFHTIVRDDARITYDALVSAGVEVGRNAVVGAKSSVQGDVPAHHVVVGSPASSVKIKPGWEDVAEPLDAGGVNRGDERRIDYDLPANLEQFDEFRRDRRPPSE